MNLVKKYWPALNIKLVALHSAVWVALLGLPYLFNASHEYIIGSNILNQDFFTITNLLHAALFMEMPTGCIPGFLKEEKDGNISWLYRS